MSFLKFFMLAMLLPVIIVEILKFISKLEEKNKIRRTEIINRIAESGQALLLLELMSDNFNSEKLKRWAEEHLNLMEDLAAVHSRGKRN